MPIPVVGQEPGPQWATDINTCLGLIDQHNHTNGSGVPITPAAIDINADLSFGNQNAVLLRSARFDAQGAPLALPEDLSCVYVSGVDLWYNDDNGNQIQITANGAVAGTPGSIANLVAPASASYVSATGTFVFQQDSNEAANIDGASHIFRRTIPSSAGLTLSPPTSLVSDYTLTLPAIPAATAFVTLDNSGNFSGSVPVAQGITLSMLAQALQQALCPVSTMLDYGGTSAPSGWLICDGTAVSRATYSALFAVVGTRFGEGDGSTTFNVPDMRGRFKRMVDGSAGRDPDSASRTAMNAGGATGNNIGSVQGDSVEPHTHDVSVSGPSVNVGSGGSPINGNGVDTWTRAYTSAVNTGNETRPINAYVNVIIKF